MPSLGTKTVRALLKGANEGGPKHTKIADLTQAKTYGQGHGAAPDMLNATPLDLTDTMSRPNKYLPQGMQLLRFNNDDILALPFKAQVNRAEYNALVNRMLKMVDAGDEKGLNAFSKRNFGRSWKVAKEMPAIQALLIPEAPR